MLSRSDTDVSIACCLQWVVRRYAAESTTVATIGLGADGERASTLTQGRLEHFFDPNQCYCCIGSK